MVVAGTTGSGDDIAAQTRDALRRIEIALGQAGATLADVVRTRIYVTDISRWREVGEVHAQAFGKIRPVTSMVEVTALIAPGLLVEIEADAYVGSAVADRNSGAGRRTRHQPVGRRRPQSQRAPAVGRRDAGKASTADQ